MRGRKGGVPEESYWDFDCILVLDGQGRPYGIYTHAYDVTDRVEGRLRLEEAGNQLAKTVSALESERDLRERFVSTLSHDLRTPLAAAKMNAQLLGKKAESAEMVRTLGVKIAAHIDRSDEMIRDLLDANRIRAGETLPLEITECKLNEIIRETIEDLGTVHGDRFLMSFPDHTVRGFLVRNGVKRVLENLCNNAVKY